MPKNFIKSVVKKSILQWYGRPEVPVETPALAGSMKQESLHFSGERFKKVCVRKHELKDSVQV